MFSLFQDLTMMSLRENKIRELPKGIGKLKKLVTFDVSNNHLKHLPPGKNCKVVSKTIGFCNH